MLQYAGFKKAHPDCILFFRMGDFYEMFDDDAVTAHAALGITLTERTSGIPMAGIPFHAAENYLRRLIEQGYRVAVCEQVQDPKDAKGVVERAVTRVITPGTLVDDSLLDDSVANEIAAVGARDEDGSLVVDIAVAELSTGAFRIRTVPAERAVDELVRLHPSEILHSDDDETRTAQVEGDLMSFLAASACVGSGALRGVRTSRRCGDAMRVCRVAAMAYGWRQTPSTRHRTRDRQSTDARVHTQASASS